MAQEKKYTKGLFNWTFLMVIAVGLILINIVSAFLYKRFDMTEDQRYSLSQGTMDFLSDEKNISERLTIKIYLEGNMPSEIKHFRNAIEDKLQEFKEYAGKRIEYQFIDPNTGTDQENNELHEHLYAKGKGLLPMDIVYQKDGSQSQMLLWPGAIITYKGSTVNTIQFLPGTQPGKPYQLNGMTDMIQNSIQNLEYILVSSIRRAIKDEKQRIGFLQGHGELTFQQTQRARALISPYFKLENVTIEGHVDALDQLDGLIIAGPKTRFSDKDLFVIDQFVLRGGRLICLIDALELPIDTLNARGMAHTTRISTGLERMLFDYGLKINDNYVIDASCAPKVVPFANQSLLPWFFHILASPTSHPISRNLEPVSLEYTNEIQFIEDDRRSLNPILTSSSNSNVTGLAPMISLGMPMNYGANPELVQNPKDLNNKRCLAGLSEGTYSSHFKNRIIDDYANNKDARFLAESSKEGKVMLVGNGRFIANKYDSMPNKMTGEMMYRPLEFNELRMNAELAQMKIPLFYGNQEFFQNMVDYVMGDNSVLDIRSRQIDIRKLDNAKVQNDANFYKIINLTLPSILVVILAFVMNFIRKKKYARV